MPTAGSVTARALLVLALVGLVTAAFPVAAQEGGSLGFPPTLDLTDPGLLKGQTHRATLHYQVHYDDPVEATFDVVPRTPQPGDGWTDASAWVTLSPGGTQTVPPTEDHPLDVAVRVPANAANGEYRAGVRIRVAPGDGPEGSGAGVEQSGTTILVLRVTGDEVKRVSSQGAPEVRDTEERGVWTLKVPLSNDGNVRANPHIKVMVWDQMRTTVLRTLWVNSTFLDPGEAGSYTLSLSDLGLPIGQYWATMEVYMDGVMVAAHSPHTFDVVEEGALKRLLQLRTIHVAGGEAWADAGDLVEVEAIVRNIGELPVTGVFKLKVARDGKLLDALESDPLEVAVSEDGALGLFYEVEKAGKYNFSGHVRYGSKVTDERWTFLNVEGGSSGAGWLLALGATAVAAGVAAMLVVGKRRRGDDNRGRRDPAGSRRGRQRAAPARRMAAKPQVRRSAAPGPERAKTGPARTRPGGPPKRRS
ncbi:MAG: hypothetical protein KY455_09810 [Euryarchaeota archaeon]|nr:hypothetical protein [Euryarchaeota archaeon]